MPTDASFRPLTLGTENNHERQRKRRPSAGQRKRTTGRQRETNRCGQANRTSQVVESSLIDTYKNELSEIENAYPGICYWEYPEGILFLAESALLREGSAGAEFIFFIPYSTSAVPRGWAFWDSGEWIGPRHTNFPDGSICAFEISDFTWQPGDQIVKLLDLYVLWAVRHLHLKKIGHWPGPQSVDEPYERLTELQDDELCGCSRPGVRKSYVDCCKKHDTSLNKFACAIGFALRTGGVRKPPASIVIFRAGRTNLPDIKNFIHDYQAS